MAEIPNRGPELRAVAITITIMATAATAMRCYVRVWMVKAFGIDDWFMLIALAAFLTNITTCLLGINYGTGRHMEDLKPSDAQTAMMYWWSCYLTYAVCMITSKISVGVFLLRITNQKIHRWIIYVALSLSTATGIAFFFICLFQCWPVQFAWDRSGTGSCLTINAVVAITITYSTFAIVTDFTFTILPMWLVWHLQMDRKTKTALIPILGMACVASIAVIARLGYVKNLTSPDFLWATLDIAIWSETEQGLAITAGSLAALRPLFRAAMGAMGISHSPQSYEDRKTPFPSAKQNWPRSFRSRTGTHGDSRTGHDVRRKGFSLDTFNHEGDEEALNRGIEKNEWDLERGYGKRNEGGVIRKKTEVRIQIEHNRPRDPWVLFPINEQERRKGDERKIQSKGSGGSGSSSFYAE